MFRRITAAERENRRAQRGGDKKEITLQNNANIGAIVVPDGRTVNRMRRSAVLISGREVQL